MASGIPVEIRDFAAFVVGQPLPDVDTAELSAAARNAMAQVAEMSGPWQAEFEDVLGSVSGYAGPGAAQMKNAMATLDKYHSDMSNGLTQLADYLDQSAAQVAYTQYSMAVQTALLITQLSVELALAPYTGGASLQDAPEEIAATRVVLSELFAGLLEELVQQTAIGAGSGVAADALTQWILSAQGLLNGVNGGQVLAGAGGGALGGLFGGFAGVLGGAGHDAVGGALTKDSGGAVDGVAGETGQPVVKAGVSQLSTGIGNEAGGAVDAQADGQPAEFNGWGVASALAIGAAAHGLHAAVGSGSHDPVAPDPDMVSGHGPDVVEQSGEVLPEQISGSGSGQIPVVRPSDDPGTGQASESGHTSVEPQTPDAATRPNQVKQTIGDQAGTSDAPVRHSIDPGPTADQAGQPAERVDQVPSPEAGEAVASGTASASVPDAVAPHRRGDGDLPVPERPAGPSGPDGSGPDRPPEGGWPVPAGKTRLPAPVAHMAREKAQGEDVLKTRPGAPGPEHHEVTLRELRQKFGALRPESSMPMFSEHLDHEVRSAWERFEADAEVVRRQLDGALPPEAGAIQWDLTENLTVAHKVTFDTALPLHEWTEPVLERHLLVWADRRDEILGAAGAKLEALTDVAGGRVPHGEPDPLSYELDAPKVPDHEPVGFADVEERYLALRRAEFAEAGMDPYDFKLSETHLNLITRDGDSEGAMRLLDERQKTLEELTAKKARAAEAMEADLAARQKRLKQDAPGPQQADPHVEDLLNTLPDVPQTIPDAGEAAKEQVPEPSKPPEGIAERLARLRADDPEPESIGRQARDSGMKIKDVLAAEKAIDKAHAEGRTADALRLTTSYLDRIRQAQEDQRATKTALRMRGIRGRQAEEAGLTKGEVSRFEYEQYLEQFGKEDGGGLPAVGKARKAWEQGLADAAARREARIEADFERRMRLLRVRVVKPSNDPRTPEEVEAAQQELEEKLNGLDAVPTAMPEPGPGSLTSDHGLDDLPSPPEGAAEPTIDPELLKRFKTVLGRKPLDEKTLLGDDATTAGNDAKPDTPTSPTPHIPKALDHEQEEKPSDVQPAKHSDAKPATTVGDLELERPRPTTAKSGREPDRTGAADRWSVNVQTRSLRRLGKVAGTGSAGDAGQDFRLEFVKGDGEGLPRAVLRAARNHPWPGDHEGLRQLTGVAGPRELRDALAGRALEILGSAPGPQDLRELLQSQGSDPQAVVDRLRESGDPWGLADDVAPRLLAEVFQLRVVLVDLDGGQEVYAPVRAGGLSDALPEFVLVRDRTRGTDHYWSATAGGDQSMGQAEGAAPDPEAEEFAQDLAAVGRLGVGTPEQLVEFGKLWRLYVGPWTGSDAGAGVHVARWNGLHFAINDALHNAGAARELNAGAEIDNGSPVVRSGGEVSGLASVVDRIASSAPGQPKHTAMVLLDWLDQRIPLGELPAAAQEFALLTHLTAVVGGERRILDGIRDALEDIAEAEDADASRLWRAIRDTWSTAVGLAAGDGFEVFSGVPGVDVGAVRAFASTIGAPGTGQYQDGGGWDGLLRAALAEAGQVVRLPSLTPPTGAGGMADLLGSLPEPLYWVVTATAHHLHHHGLSPNARRQARELAERMRKAGKLRPTGLDGGAPPVDQPTATLVDHVRDTPLTAAAEHLAGLDPVQQTAVRQQATRVISRYQPPNAAFSFDEGEMDAGQLHRWYGIQYSLTLDPTGATADALASDYAQRLTGQGAPPTAAPIDLDDVPLPELDALRTQTPARPGDDANGGQRADYAMALALTSAPTKLLDHATHRADLALSGTQQYQTRMAHGLLMASGAYLHASSFAYATVQSMKRAYDLARQTDKNGMLLTSASVGQEIAKNVNYKPLVEGFWLAVGLRESGVPDPKGAWAVVRRAVETLVIALENAEPHLNTPQKAARIARRVYQSDGQPTEGQVAVVAELLRQRDENPQSFAPPTAGAASVAAPLGLDAVPLPELDALREIPAPPGKNAGGGQRADYAMALALISTPIEPLNHKTHSMYLAPSAGRHQIQSTYGLLVGSGGYLDKISGHATVQNMKKSYDLARQTDKNGKYLTASSISSQLTGHNDNRMMIEGFWLAVGLRQSGELDPRGARAVVRRAVDSLAGVVEKAEPGINVRQKAVRIAGRLYWSTSQPTEIQVAVVEELLRQRDENPQTFVPPTVGPANIASPIGLDAVPLPELDALRTQSPTLPGEDAEGSQRADYAMALALTSTAFAPLNHKTHGPHLAPNTGKQQGQSSYGLLMGAGAHLDKTIAHATVQNMKQSYDLARQTDRHGKHSAASSISAQLTGRSNSTMMIEGFWLAVGLRESGVPDLRGARAVVRRAVDSLAGVVEKAEPGIGVWQKAVRIAGRLYRSTSQPTEIQVAVVEELLRQRDENPQAFAPAPAGSANSAPASNEPRLAEMDVSDDVLLPDAVELSGPDPQHTRTPAPPGNDTPLAPSSDSVALMEPAARVGVRVEYVNGRFRAVLQLRSTTDSSATVDVSRWNFARRRTLEALGGTSTLTAALERVRDAARTFPPLAQLVPADSAWLPAAAMGLEVELDEIGLARLDEVAGALSLAGVEVYWPREDLGRLTTRTTIVRRAGRNAPTHKLSVIAEQILEFRWELALDGEPLTSQEMERLVAEQSSLVRLRDRWVLVPPGQREELARRVRLFGRDEGTAVQLGTGDSTVLVKSLAEVSESAVAAAVSMVPVGVQPLGGRLEQALYPHQQAGVSWLTQVTGMGLGGILADEMGLGKTVQTLAVHLRRQQNPATAGPTLVVAPTSLLTVWQDEAAYWAPWVSTRIYHGGGRDLALLATHEIVLTTYKTMVNSAEALREVGWGLVVADEAQEIKNHQTRAAKTIRTLRSHARIALSGTPVENTLTDLWSILDWTTPGLLGTQGEFVSSYGSAGQPGIPLAQLIAPFVLRRKKDGPNIQPRLIPATHTVHSLGLTVEQTARYEARIRKAIDERPRTGRMVGFYSALVHDLKQLCNHPAQFNAKEELEEALTGRSRKFDKLDELITGITGRRESVLVFTQYVGTGRMIMQHLRNRRIPGLFLHGDINRKQRGQMVEDFRNGTADVFVISLKTGGLGLTLTRANHVIHYDQWWNPAVEEQATARAHRIGQTKPVEVHHLITHDTVEELIKNIQDTKANVADDLLEEVQARFAELTDTQLDTALQGQLPPPHSQPTSPQPMEIDTDESQTDADSDNAPAEIRTVLGKRAAQASPAPRKRRNTRPSGTSPDHTEFLSFLAALSAGHSRPAQQNAATGPDAMGRASTRTNPGAADSEHGEDLISPDRSEHGQSSNGGEDVQRNGGSEHGSGEESVSRRKGVRDPGDSDFSSSSDSDSSDSDPGNSGSSDSDSSSSSSDSSSNSLLSSFGDELRKSGLEALISAAEAEADTAYEQTLPAPGRQRNQVVERVVLVAEQTPPTLGRATPWGMAALHPYYAVHWNRLTRHPVTPQDGVELVRLLSYTPTGLDLTSDELTTLLSPADQFRPQAVDTLLQRMGVTLGRRVLAPGENSAGQQVKPVEKALAEAGVTNRYPNGRLTPQAVTVLAAWAVHWGSQQVQDPNGDGMADPWNIAERLFGRNRDRAAAFVRHHLDEFGVRYPGSPPSPPRTDETGDPQATTADRKNAALHIAMVHTGYYGSVNSQHFAAILAGHPTASPREVDKALDLLEHSGYSHHLRGTTDWNSAGTTTAGASRSTGTSAAGNAFGDPSVEASAGVPVRDVWGDLTDDGKALLKAKALEYGGAQAAVLGGVDLDGLAARVFAVGYRRRGRRLLRRWLKGSGLRILTADEAAIAHVLAAVTEGQLLAISEGVDLDSLDYQVADLPALVAVEPDPVLRGAKATAILEAGGFFGEKTTRSGALFNDMMVAVAFLEKDAADSRLHREEARQQARDSGRRLSDVLLRASAEETRNDTLDFLAAQFLQGLPPSVARALADFWHQTFAFLGSVDTQSRRITAQPGSVLHTTPNAYKALADRAKTAIEAQDTFRPDYPAVAADLFHPSPTTWQIDAVHYMSGLSQAEMSKKAAKAAARALLALVGEEVPPRPTADTPFQDRIDYVLWKTALIINQNVKVVFADLYREAFGIYTSDYILLDKSNMVRGWIEAFGLGGAQSRTNTLSYIPEVIGSLRDAAFQRPGFRHLKRQKKQDDGSWGAGFVINGVRQALGMAGEPIPANGLRGKLAYAARMAGGMQGASVSEVAAQIFFTGKPGADQRALISELLHPQLNLEDSRYPGIAQKIVDVIGDTVPAIPDQNSTAQQRATWNALSDDAKRQRRIDFVIAKAAHGLARGTKISLADLARQAFPDAGTTTAGQNEALVRGWLESFGLDQYYLSIRESDLLPRMPEVFESIWQADTEKRPTLDQIQRTVFGNTEIHSNVRVSSWFHVLGVNGKLPPGGVRDRLLAEVRARFGAGASTPSEVAREVLGVKWPSPAQLVMAEQLLRLSGKWQPPTPGGVLGDPSVTAAAILSHYQGGALPDPGINTTMPQRIDYAIWKAASTIHSGQEISLTELTLLVFNGVPDNTTPLPTGTSPVGMGGRMYQLLGILTSVGLHSLHSYRSVTLFTSPAVGEYLLQKAWDGDGASPHSVSLEITFPATSAQKSFYRGVFETFGLRGAPLPATGIRADLKAAVTTAIQPGHAHGQGSNPPQPDQMARLLFGEGPLTHVHFTVAEQWIKLAATDQPPPPPTTGPIVPQLDATLTRKAEYAVSRLLHTRTHHPHRPIEEIIAEITEDLFASPTDSYGLALTSGILEGTGLIPLGSDLTVEDIRKITDNATLQYDIYERVITGPILTAHFPGRRHLFAARVRGILAGRGLLPPPRRGGPLRQLHQRVVDEAHRLRNANRPLNTADIARTVFHLTTDPDAHQRTTVAEILRAYGLPPAPDADADAMDTSST